MGDEERAKSGKKIKKFIEQITYFFFFCVNDNYGRHLIS